MSSATPPLPDPGDLSAEFHEVQTMIREDWLRGEKWLRAMDVVTAVFDLGALHWYERLHPHCEGRRAVGLVGEFMELRCLNADAVRELRDSFLEGRARSALERMP